MMIVNYASSIVNKLEDLLTDDARVVIYDRHVFIVQTTESTGKYFESIKRHCMSIEKYSILLVSISHFQPSAVKVTLTFAVKETNLLTQSATELLTAVEKFIAKAPGT
jgi:hypothetical protein